ncbi:MAG: Hsp70 family protein [Pseudobdellovibrionaceae bacterium]
MTQDTLAIDFGTSHSLVGAVVDGKPHEAIPIDPLSPDPTLMRTLLYFPDGENCFYGAEAIKAYIEQDMEGRLFRSFKSHLPNQNYLGTMVGKRVLSLENLVGTFLLELKKRSEKHFQRTFDSAILGRPARHSMDEVAEGFALHRMKKAAEFAGFKQVRFVPEPLAAALEYRKEIHEPKILLIGDFGGGTSDFTVLRVSPGSFRSKDVLSVEGCPLAGDALDSVFMSERLNQSFGAKSLYKLPLSENILEMPKPIMERLNKPAHIVHLKEPETYNFIKQVQKCSLRPQDASQIQRLFTLIEDNQIFSFFEEIERTKKTLSDKETAKFKFDYPDLETEDVFSRQEFEMWSAKVKADVFAAMDRALVTAGIIDDQVDVVFLTGGTAYVPFIRRVFTDRFGSDRVKDKKFFHSVLSGLVEYGLESGRSGLELE